MPYIEQPRREALCKYDDPRNAGELNYAFSDLIHRYLKTNGLRYQTINDILGALTGASAEFYRRIVSPYEDQKIRSNGDVYDADYEERRPTATSKR